MKSIAFFNNKGGVSKTTTAFNLGWKLAEMGHRVLLVDADPQCNLTGMVMGFSSHQDLEEFYVDHPEQNLKNALRPAFESRPQLLSAVDCVEVENCEGLFLLPGHVGLAEYEVQLGLAQELSGSIQALQNLPGSFRYLYEITAASLDAEIIIIDMSPGLGSINQNLATTADYILVPAAPDVFSVMAIDSISRILPRWIEWGKRASQMEIFQEAAYPLNQPKVKLLGTIVQRYNVRNSAPSRKFLKYFEDLDDTIENKLVPALQDTGSTLSDSVYAENSDEGSRYRIASIPNFNSLIAASQRSSKPVFTLTQSDVGQVGSAWNTSEGNIERFNEIFETLAKRALRIMES